MPSISPRRQISHRPQLIMQLPGQRTGREIWMGSGRAPSGCSKEFELFHGTVNGRHCLGQVPDGGASGQVVCRRVNRRRIE